MAVGSRKSEVDGLAHRRHLACHRDDENQKNWSAKRNSSAKSANHLTMPKSPICSLIRLVLLLNLSFVQTAVAGAAFLVATPPQNIQDFALPLFRFWQKHDRSTSSSSLSHTVLFAKKPKKKNQSQDSKQSGFAWASSFTLKPYEAPSTRELVATAAASFQSRTGKPICDEIVGVADIPKAFWRAPVACVIVKPIKSKDNEEEEGVRVLYANVAALETVGLTADQWDQLILNPELKKIDESSSSSSTRLVLDLPTTMEKAYESGYQKKILRKVRSDNGQPSEQQHKHDIGLKDGQRWKLERSALFDGKFVTTELGIAYAWQEWILDDTTICGLGGKRRELITVDGLKQAIENQAAQVRSLKEDQGLTNNDPKVKNAVSELLRLKGLLETTQ
jgi:hypothetical protein